MNNIVPLMFDFCSGDPWPSQWDNGVYLSLLPYVVGGSIDMGNEMIQS